MMQSDRNLKYRNYRMWRYLVLLLVFTLLQCTMSVEDPLDENELGYNYYPLQVGSERIYQIDSIQFDLGDGGLPVYDSTTFYLREIVKEIIPDLEEKDLYRIERSRADTLAGPWTIVDVITRQLTGGQAFSTENNIKLINLVFPVRRDVRWNGTSYLNDQIIVYVRGEKIEMYKDWEFKVLDEGIPEQVGGLQYDAVATIQQCDSDNPFEKRYSIEKYAKGIGLVFRERQIVDSRCKFLGDNAQCVGLEWKEKAGRGFFTQEILIDHN